MWKKISWLNSRFQCTVIFSWPVKLIGFSKAVVFSSYHILMKTNFGISFFFFSFFCGYPTFTDPGEMAIVLCIIVPHFLSLRANVRMRLSCCVRWCWEHCVHIPGESVGRGAAVDVCCCPMQLGLDPVHKHCKSYETGKDTSRQDHGAIGNQLSSDWLKSISWKSGFVGVCSGRVCAGQTH